MGRLVSGRRRDRVECYIAKDLRNGARIAAAGQPAGLDHSLFVETTVSNDVGNGHTIAQEEISGPVLSVIRYSPQRRGDDDRNASEYGLDGTVWTSDTDP